MSKEELTEGELKALVSLLEDDDPEVRFEIEERIMSLGAQIVPFLEGQWESNLDPDVQTRLEEIVHTIQFDQLKTRLADWNEEEDPELLQGLWLVATYQYPDLEFEKLVSQVEQIYYDVWLEFKEEMHPEDQIKVLNNVFFGNLKFTGNKKNFHSPGNSMINIVLETRRGNPITLCAIYLLIANKLKMPIYGVNLPNLFIVTYKDEHIQTYINVFNKGIIFTKEDIDNYLEHLQVNQNDIFYQPCSNRDLIRRCLRNLVVSFEKLSEHSKADEIKVLLQSVTSGLDTDV